MSRPVAVLLRFDTEDFLTPESDEAALFLAEALTRRGLRATFPMTAWKVKSLLSRKRGDVLQAISKHAVGYHSTSHSFHPTIAEELCEVADAEAERRFLQREEDGLRLVADRFERLPCAYTQPGGNWVAEATAALRAWGVPLYYSEDWNSYIDVAGRPFFLGGVLAYAGEVAAPKPFLSRLPGDLAAARDRLGLAIRRERDGGPGGIGLVNVVSHPTELVTETFWDQANFARGSNRPREDWAPPVVRPVQVVRLAEGAFEEWLQTLCGSGVDVWTAEDLVRAFPDPAAGASFDTSDAQAIASAWAGGRVGSIAIRGVSLTASEAITLLAQAARVTGPGGQRLRLTTGSQSPPWGACEAVSGGGAFTYQEVLAAADALLAGDRLPAVVPVGEARLSLLDMATALAKAYLLHLGHGDKAARCHRAEGTLLPARHVKPPERLHWDWPIFPPDFRPEAVRRRAIDATWTLKPAEAALCDYVV